MRPHGTAQQLEARRRRAAELLQQGKTLSDVARRIEASVSSVSRWRDAVAQQGEQALTSKPVPGRPPRLSEAQKRRLLKAIARGSRRWGFATDLWTCARIGNVIQRLFGVEYHVDYVGTLLHKLGWSVQKPALRAREQDAMAIAQWRSETWPRLKKRLERKASLVFLDETGLMLQPLRRRTWAPQGSTPVLCAWDRHDRWSVLGALSLAPWALRLGCYFRFHDHNIAAEDVGSFLRMLHRQLRRPLIVVLDRWGVHRKAIRLLKERPAPWLQVEWLPAYAPELNPVEHLWNHTKWADLANFIPDDAEHLRRAAQQSLTDQRHDPQRLYSCFLAAQLP